jgi:glycosyltransferase involved in cell wall biosynthesis
VRIAVVTHYRRKVAGAEAYLEVLLSALSADNEFAFVCDQDGPCDRPPIRLPENSPVWTIRPKRRDNTLRELRAWKPDIVYCHGTGDPDLEAQVLRFAPSILTVHTYYGTCISGTKTCLNPKPAPCTRTFGPACLVHYFPRQCGGRNPLTMLRLYRLQQRRRRLLKGYRAVLTLSEHMRQEVIHHGVDPSRAIRLPPLGFSENVTSLSGRVKLPLSPGPLRLLFLGRMEFLKGGHLLIGALPKVTAALGPIHVTFAGDGPELPAWKSLAARAAEADRRLKIEFVGWIGEGEKQSLFGQTDALIVPSVWPEPYGLVGLEAARFGVPSVAFDVGGIRDWLHDGVTGCLAPGDPPTAAGLGEAIVRCLRNPGQSERLSAGAREAAARVSRSDHIAAVRQIFDRVRSRPRAQVGSFRRSDRRNSP